MHTTVWFNALALRPGGSGVQTYARELIAALSRDQSLALSAAVQQDALNELPPVVSADVRPTCAGVRRVMQGLRTPPAADIVHGLDVDLPWQAGGAHTVATVHDTSVVDVPWAHPATRARGERMLLRRTARTADEIIVPSAYTAERVHALYGRTAHITPLAAAPWAVPPNPDEISRVNATYGLPDRFALQVGTVEPRKLTSLLVAAARDTSTPLVLAGLGSERLTSPGVLGLGHVPASDLPALFAAATVTTYLTAYEGFGLPPLEAMACGAAVVASAIAPLTEVLGDAARLVPNRLESLSTALVELRQDHEQVDELRERGLAHAARYSWRDTARATAHVYRGMR